MRTIAPLLLCLTGCGGDKSGEESGPTSDTGTNPDSNVNVSEPVTPDCSWFTQDNCWKSAVRSVDACVPADKDSGTFSSNFETCDFGDGSRLTLSSNAAFYSPFEWSSLDLRAFQLSRPNGAECISYLAEDGNESSTWSINTPEGAVEYEVDNLRASGGIITCPDGTRYDLGTDVMSCPEANAHWPFISHAATGSMLTYSLQGGDETVGLFSCAL